MWEVPTPETRNRSVLAYTVHVHSLPLDNIFRAVPEVQQIMTEFNGAVRKQKLWLSQKKALNLVKQNGHYTS
jgi:hypothetical protein